MQSAGMGAGRRSPEHVGPLIPVAVSLGRALEAGTQAPGDAGKSLGSPMLQAVLPACQTSRRRPPLTAGGTNSWANCQEGVAMEGAGTLDTSLWRERHVRP